MNITIRDTIAILMLGNHYYRTYENVENKFSHRLALTPLIQVNIFTSLKKAIKYLNKSIFNAIKYFN